MIQSLLIDSSEDQICIKAKLTLFGRTSTETYHYSLDGVLPLPHETQRLLNLIVHGLIHLEETIQEDLPCFGVFTQFTEEERHEACLQYHLRRLRIQIEKVFAPLTF